MNDFVIYVLPPNWIWTELGNLGVVVSGGTPATREERFWEGEIPWVTPADLSDHKEKYITKGKRSITELGLDYSSAILLPEGSVLFSSRAPIGYTVIAKNSIATNQGFKNLVPVKSINADYIYYYLKSAKELIETRASGTTFLELSSSAFSKIPIPLPPLQEQKRIVFKIEELYSKVNQSEISLKAAQDQLKIYRQTLLKHAFQGKLTEEWRLITKPPHANKLLNTIKEQRYFDYRKSLEHLTVDVTTEKIKFRELSGGDLRGTVLSSDVESLPEMPDGWVFCKVEELLEQGRDCAYGVLQPGPEVENGIRLIRVGDINNGKISHAGLKRISPEIAKKHKRTFLKGGEVLISVVGAIGRTAVVPETLVGANVARAVAVMPISKLLNPKYCELYFRRQEKIKEMNLLSHEVARKTLNLEDVKRAKVILCSRAEQDEIVNIVEFQFSILDSLDQSISEALYRTNVLKRNILKTAFEGKLVGQDPNDESAIELLKHIFIEKEGLLVDFKENKRSKPKKMIMAEKQETILEILEKSDGPLSAKKVWERSKHKDDIEEFYAELKKLQNKVKEVEKGVLALAE